jgi:hypothetical protein
LHIACAGWRELPQRSVLTSAAGQIVSVPRAHALATKIMSWLTQGYIVVDPSQKNLSFSDRYKNKVNIVPLKYLFCWLGYSCVYFFVQFLSFTNKTGSGITLYF